MIVCACLRLEPAFVGSKIRRRGFHGNNIRLPPPPLPLHHANSLKCSVGTLPYTTPLHSTTTLDFQKNARKTNHQRIKGRNKTHTKFWTASRAKTSPFDPPPGFSRTKWATLGCKENPLIKKKQERTSSQRAGLDCIVTLEVKSLQIGIEKWKEVTEVSNYLLDFVRSPITSRRVASFFELFWRSKIFVKQREVQLRKPIERSWLAAISNSSITKQNIKELRSAIKSVSVTLCECVSFLTHRWSKPNKHTESSNPLEIRTSKRFRLSIAAIDIPS
jgi:hypothetical protein